MAVDAGQFISQMKGKIKATITLFSRNMLRLPWRMHIIKEEVIRKRETKRTCN